MYEEDRWLKVVKWVGLVAGILCLIWFAFAVGYAFQPEERWAIATLATAVLLGFGAFLFVLHIQKRDEGDYYEWVLKESGKALVANSLELNLYDLLTLYAKWRVDTQEFKRLAKSVVAIVSSYLNSGGTLVAPALVEVVSHVAGSVSESQGKALYVSLDTERSGQDKRFVLITLTGGIEPCEIRGKVEVV